MPLVRRALAAVFFVHLFGSPAVAGVTAVESARTAVEIAGDRYLVHDVLIDFQGNLRSQQMFLELDAGEIYQFAGLGSDTPPNPLAIELFPSLAYDSFVTVGGFDTSVSESLLVVGGAVDIPQAPAARQFDTSVISIAWAPGIGVNITAGTRYPTARITLSADAAGDWWYFGSTTGTAAPFLARRTFGPESGCPYGACSLGDFDGSGTAGNADLTLLLDHWGASIPPAPSGWVGFSPTGPRVSNDDLTFLLDAWANRLEEAARNVPEPSSVFLVGIAIVGILVRGRRNIWASAPVTLRKLNHAYR